MNRKYTKEDILLDKISFAPLSEYQVKMLSEHFTIDMSYFQGGPYFRFYYAAGSPGGSSCTSYSRSPSDYLRSTKEITFDDFIFELPMEYIVMCNDLKQSTEVFDTYYRTLNGINFNLVLVCNDDSALHISNDIMNFNEKYHNLPVISYKGWKSFQKEKEINKMLKGYKLSGKVTAAQAADFLGCSKFEKDGLFFWDTKQNVYIEKARNSGVLDIWFEPVYDTTPDIIIEGYKGEFQKDQVTFGCITVTKEVMPTIRKLLDNGMLNQFYRNRINEVLKYYKF